MAFVLDGIAGVLDVYAVDSAEVDLEFAIRLEHGTAKLAAAHYALLRVLRREECSRVLFFETRPPRGLAHALRRLVLTVTARDESRARVLDAPIDEPIPPKRVRSSAPFAALLVGCSEEVYRSVVTGLGVGARRVVESDPQAGVARAMTEEFDVLLCAAHVAFGPRGFFDSLRAQDPLVASRVVLVAASGEYELTLAQLEDMGQSNTCLTMPVAPSLVLEIVRDLLAPWRLPIPSVEVGASKRPAGSSPPRVLVIDDPRETEALISESPRGRFVLEVTDNPWTALDRLALDPPDLILCSTSLKAGSTPLYRLLWNANPPMKARFMLLATTSRVGEDRASQRRLVERPLTTERITEALRRSGLLSGPSA